VPGIKALQQQLQQACDVLHSAGNVYSSSSFWSSSIVSLAVHGVLLLCMSFMLELKADTSGPAACSSQRLLRGAGCSQAAAETWQEQQKLQQQQLCGAPLYSHGVHTVTLPLCCKLQQVTDMLTYSQL
jgi:hypothetical protein